MIESIVIHQMEKCMRVCECARERVNVTNQKLPK